MTIEGKKSLKSIQQEFANKLSKKVILKTTALSLNITARRVISQVKKDVKKEYTINNKYLNRMATLKPASGTVEGLYAAVSYSYKPVPMVGFKNKDNNKSKSPKKRTGGVTIEIKRGRNQLLKHAFIATMASGHKGIYAQGLYKGKTFINDKVKTEKGKARITEMRGPSPMTMVSNKDIQKRTVTYVKTNLPPRLRALLQNEINKLTK